RVRSWVWRLRVRAPKRTWHSGGTGFWLSSVARGLGGGEEEARPAGRPAVQRRLGLKAYGGSSPPGRRQGAPRIERPPPRPCSGHREAARRSGPAGRGREGQHVRG